jgi:hypothetical protein
MVLCICPYVVTNVYLLVLTGIVFTALPFVIKR